MSSGPTAGRQVEHNPTTQYADAVGCDLSIGMLRSADPGQPLVNADATGLPFPDDAFDIVLAPHMLYHVPDRRVAVDELRRVLRTGGVCVAVTNGARHLWSVRRLVEAAVGAETAGWQMSDPSISLFSLENGAEQLRPAFASITCVRPDAVGSAVVRDATVVADYVASTGDHYQPEVVGPWSEVTEQVRRAVEQVIATEGAFVVTGDPGAFVCR